LTGDGDDGADYGDDDDDDDNDDDDISMVMDALTPVIGRHSVHFAIVIMLDQYWLPWLLCYTCVIDNMELCDCE